MFVLPVASKRSSSNGDVTLLQLVDSDLTSRNCSHDIGTATRQSSVSKIAEETGR